MDISLRLNMMNSERVKPLKTKKLTSSTPSLKVAKSLRGRKPNGKLAQAIFESPEPLSDSYEILPPVELKSIPHARRKPSYLDSVCEAIQKIGVPKNGASYISIRNWIIGNRETTKSLTVYLKRAIENGLESGVLSRSARCENFVGLRGSFVLTKQKSPKKEKPKVAPANKGSKSSVQKTQKAKGSSAKGSSAKGSSAQGASVSNTVHSQTVHSKMNLEFSLSISIPVVKQVPKRLNFSVTSIMEARSTKLKSAVGKTVTKPKVNAKLAPKKTSLGRVVPVSKAIERLNGIKKPKQVISKAPKAKPVEKTLNPEVQAKETKTKKLYSSYVKPVQKNFSRKDLSDTELEVKPSGRKSMKSYSSDTDISLIASKKDPNPIKPKRKLKATNSKGV